MLAHVTCQPHWPFPDLVQVAPSVGVAVVRDARAVDLCHAFVGYAANTVHRTDAFPRAIAIDGALVDPHVACSVGRAEITGLAIVIRQASCSRREAETGARVTKVSDGTIGIEITKIRTQAIHVAESVSETIQIVDAGLALVNNDNASGS